MSYGKKIVLKNAQKIAIFEIGSLLVFWTWGPQFWSDFAKIGFILLETPILTVVRSRLPGKEVLTT